MPDYECPHCQQKQSQLVIAAHYVHIFWIPVFPFKKTASIVCASCHYQQEEKAITAGTNVSVKQLKAAVPIPKILFVGLVLIVSGIGYLIYQNSENAKRTSSYIQSPRAGDVYMMKSKADTATYNHYLMKVREVSGDSLIVSFSSYYYNGRVTELDPKDGFYNVTYSIHKKSIGNFQETGELLEVMRDYSSSSGFDREVDLPMADSVQSN